MYTAEISQAGNFPLTATASIQVHKDYNQSESETMKAQVSFTLVIVAGCDSTSFIEWTLEGAESFNAYVLGDSVTIALGPVEDTVSRQSGNNDGLTHCGERDFKINDIN